jgi:HSP20 family protein
MGYFPRTDVSQNNDGMLIEAAVPGLSLKDVTLELVDNIIVISGRHAERNQYSRYNSKELYTGYFSRRFVVNAAQFDLGKITSKIVNGLLTIHIPLKNTMNTNKIQSINIQEEDSNGNK